MAATPSTMLPLGTHAPSWTMINTVDGRTVRYPSGNASDPITVIAFICNHCPYVLHIIDRFVDVAQWAQQQGVQILCVSSNDPATYPQDGPEQMQHFAAAHRFTFPYLFDESQEVARSYQAACTPDFYLFDHSGVLVYRGRFDAATPGNSEPVTGGELRAAITAVLQGRQVSSTQLPSIGCNIKWRSHHVRS